MEKLPWYEQSVEEVSARLSTDASNGLSSGEVKSRLEKYGLNELEQKRYNPFSNVSCPAEGLYGYHSAGSQSGIPPGREVVDSLVIIGIVIVNAVLGVVQEYRAGKALEALKKMSAPNAKVIRDGKELLVPASELVPGDLVFWKRGLHTGRCQADIFC